ncbi:hypothetical protein MPLB_1460066 [Mesorhizobium sp. ORS 3324]|nr:hypothetical protein MPLB_1460066 [Mesorhizobium sp. ORS 3324]
MGQMPPAPSRAKINRSGANHQKNFERLFWSRASPLQQEGQKNSQMELYQLHKWTRHAARALIRAARAFGTRHALGNRSFWALEADAPHDMTRYAEGRLRQTVWSEEQRVGPQIPPMQRYFISR